QPSLVGGFDVRFFRRRLRSFGIGLLCGKAQMDPRYGDRLFVRQFCSGYHVKWTSHTALCGCRYPSFTYERVGIEPALAGRIAGEVQPEGESLLSRGSGLIRVLAAFSNQEHL